MPKNKKKTETEGRPEHTPSEHWAELLAQVERDGGAGVWLQNVSERIDTLEEHDEGRRAADRAVAERLTEIETDGTSRRLEGLETGHDGTVQRVEQLEAGLATALGSGLIVKTADLEGRLQALEEWRSRWGVAERARAVRISDLAGVVLEHAKQLEEIQGGDFDVVYRVKHLGRWADILEDRIGELEVHLSATRPTPIEAEGDGETLVDVDDVDDELRILRHARLAASVAAEATGLGGTHILSPVLVLLLDLVTHYGATVDELEQYNEAAGCVLELLAISKEFGDRPEISNAAVTAAHALCSTLRDELEGRGALGVDCG